MGYWMFGTVAAVLACEIVLLVLWCGDRRPVNAPTLGPGLPDPTQTRRMAFTTTCRGYDRHEVDDAYGQLAEAYDALYQVASRPTLERARRRLAGEGPAGITPWPADPQAGRPVPNDPEMADPTSPWPRDEG